IALRVVGICGGVIQRIGSGEHFVEGVVSVSPGEGVGPENIRASENVSLRVVGVICDVAVCVGDGSRIRVRVVCPRAGVGSAASDARGTGNGGDKAGKTYLRIGIGGCVA